MTDASARCPRCGAVLVPGGPEGLCRGCLLRSALEGDEEDGSAGFLGESRGEVPEQIRTLGDYELVCEIARGGMGVVYRARQRSLGRDVALKVLLFGQFAGPSAEARFRSEATAAGRLQHPNVVGVFEVGRSAGQWFLAMELVEGRDLGARVAQGVMTSREAAALGEQVGWALQHAHDKGVLHRDLKPSNILLDPDGRPRITDFGLAKLLDSAEGTTLSGQVLGSPGYLAPEQAGLGGASGEVGPAADVYGLGATLYFAITGRPPFEDDGVAATLERVRTSDPVAPRLLNPKVHRDLETIVLRCLQREPGRRFRSAAEVADDLGRFLRGEPIRARPVAGWERAWLWACRKPMAASVVGLAILLAVGGPAAAWQMNRLRLRAEGLVRENRERLAELQAGTGLGLAESGAGLEALPWLVDALRIGGPGTEVHRIQLGILGSRLPKLEAMWKVGNRVRDAWLTDGGRTLVTWHDLDGNEPGPALWAWSVDTGRPVELDRPPGRAGLALAVSRDRSAILIPEEGRLRLRRRVGTNVVVNEIPAVEGASAAAFSRDVRKVAVGTSSGRVMVVPLDREGAEVRHWSFTNSVEKLEFSESGARLMVRLGGAYVRVIDLTTGRITRNAGRKHPVTAAALNPDASDILVATADGHADIWTLFRTTRRFEVAGDPGITAVAWEPGGTTVATASRGGRVRIWTVYGRRLVSPFLAHGAAVEHILFLPGGRRVLTIDAERLARVWLLPSDLREASTEFEEDDVVESARETLRAAVVNDVVAGRSGGVEWKAGVLEDGRVRIRTSAGQTLWTSEALRAPVQALTMEGGKVRIQLAGGGQSEVEVRTEARGMGELVEWGELLSARRLREDGAMMPLGPDELIARWTRAVREGRF